MIYYFYCSRICRCSAISRSISILWSSFFSKQLSNCCWHLATARFRLLTIRSDSRVSASAASSSAPINANSIVSCENGCTNVRNTTIINHKSYMGRMLSKCARLEFLQKKKILCWKVPGGNPNIGHLFSLRVQRKITFKS